jgi:hypothetical protein
MSNVLEVGTKIRSYDFFGIADYFIEGIIVDVDNLNRVYGVKVVKTVHAGKKATGHKFVDVDFMGQRMVDDQWNRIEVVG